MRKIALTLIFLALPLLSYAETNRDSSVKEAWKFPYTQEIGVFTGFAIGRLEGKENYRIIPGIVRLGYNLNSIGFGFTDLIKPVANKFHFRPKGFTEFMLEPFLNTVISPDSNVETGCVVLLKYAYPATEKLYPYGFAGGGVIYLTQHTREQSTQWNFSPQIGGGITYFFKKNRAFNVEYRYRHVSNAGLKEPNRGINVSMILVGLSLFY